MKVSRPVERFEVPIKTWLQPEVFRSLNHLATERGTTVAVLVAVAATQAVTPRQPTTPARRTYRSLSNDPARFALFRELLKTDMTMKQIAERLGVSYSTVYNHLQRARSIS